MKKAGTSKYAGSSGLCEVVTHAEEMTPALERLLSSARRELLKLSLDEGLSQQCISQQPWQNNGYCGTAVRFFMRFDHRPEGLPILYISSHNTASSLVISDWTLLRDDGALAKAAAYAEYAVSPDAEDLATQYGLLTSDTSLLLVKVREESQKYHSEELVRVPQMATMPMAHIYQQMPLPYADAGSDEKPSVRPLWNPLRIFSKKRKPAMLALEDIECRNPLIDMHDLEGGGISRLDYYKEEFAFTSLVELWSRTTKENENGLVAPGFWQSEVSNMPADTLESLKDLVREQYPQLSDDQCRLLVPVVMVLLVAEDCRLQVLYEPLVIAAQDLMFSMPGPDDGKWKQLKEPCNATYAKSFARPLPYFI